MSKRTRRALDRLIAALEQHHAAALRADELPAAEIDAAEDELSDAFFTYDDALFTRLGVELPFDILDDADDEDDDDEDGGFAEDTDDDLVDIEETDLLELQRDPVDDDQLDLS